MNIKKQNMPRILRWGVLTGSTVFYLFFSKCISEHAICPIGGFEMFFGSVFHSGFSIAGLFSGMVLIFLVMSIVSILFRRAFCGYICPFGAVQELFEKIGKRVLPRKIRAIQVPVKMDRIGRWLKYFILASFIVGAGLWGGHWMIAGDPFIVFMGLFKGAGLVSQFHRNPTAFVFLAAIFVFSFFLGKGFCKYLCPAGAWYALLSKLSPNRIVRNKEKCVSCGFCSKVCSMNIDVAHLDKVTTAECIGCRECVNVCPKEGALSAPIGNLHTNTVLVPVAAAAFFSGSIALSVASMPPRGERPGSGEEHRYGVNEMNEDQQAADAIKLGGCPDCIGCGFCRTV